MLTQSYGARERKAIDMLCEQFKKNNHINPYLYKKFDVKRGLRNSDGTGVLAGLTLICNVHGYVINEGEREPIDGQLIYRGNNIKSIVEDCLENKRYGYEEVAYLLLFGLLPTKSELDYFKSVLSSFRELPKGFVEDVILDLPSRNIMNKMQSAILSLYTYDDYPDSVAIDQELQKAIAIIAKLPSIMVAAYHSKAKSFDGKSLVLHPNRPEESIAQSILSTLRYDRGYTEDEAHLLDMMLMIHAEHGGGNNSTFTCRTLTSSGTDAYSAYAGAIGSLKGPRHGGANLRVMEMLAALEEAVSNNHSDGEVRDFLVKLMNKEAGDRSGLIYGMGHAVYTKSDPRAVIIKEHAMKMAEGTPYQARFSLLEQVERLTPEVFAEIKGIEKTMCANVDLYSGLVYQMLEIPQELFTPLFAVARISGWAAHRMEELLTGNRILRPAYKSVTKERVYKRLEER